MTSYLDERGLYRADRRIIHNGKVEETEGGSGRRESANTCAGR